MKKKISHLINKLGGYTAYSGKTKTMYINPVYNEESIIAAIVLLTLSHDLPFTIVIN